MWTMGGKRVQMVRGKRGQINDADGAWMRHIYTVTAMTTLPAAVKFTAMSGGSTVTQAVAPPCLSWFRAWVLLQLWSWHTVSRRLSFRMSAIKACTPRGGGGRSKMVVLPTVLMPVLMIMLMWVVVVVVVVVVVWKGGRIVVARMIAVECVGVD